LQQQQLVWEQMAKIAATLVNENLAHARNGEVVLYKRGDSKRWQARFKLKDLKWHRVATKHVNNNDRPNMALGGFTPKQKLAMAA
jgi:hypothetical protein